MVGVYGDLSLINHISFKKWICLILWQTIYKHKWLVHLIQTYNFHIQFICRGPLRIIDFWNKLKFKLQRWKVSVSALNTSTLIAIAAHNTIWSILSSIYLSRLAFRVGTVTFYPCQLVIRVSTNSSKVSNLVDNTWGTYRYSLLLQADKLNFSIPTSILLARMSRQGRDLLCYYSIL
jgi:hypothetical protein